ncbi:MAG: gliding motility lipoprotein GldH [Bacteroidales bacterium]|nr:gliding motility lipoprotein GldH [Bacteroidales bacterium]
MITYPKILFFIFIPLSLFLARCGDESLYDRYVSFPDETWMAGDTREFSLEVRDTLLLYDFYLNIRNTTDYPYSNLYLFMDTQMPDGGKARDTIEVFLADRMGEWLGRGLGKIKESNILIRQKLLFPVSGTYTFRMEQAMRETELKGITDIGIRIEKASSVQ